MEAMSNCDTMACNTAPGSRSKGLSMAAISLLLPQTLTQSLHQNNNPKKGATTEESTLHQQREQTDIEENRDLQTEIFFAKGCL
jgi:hypothetical protein